MELWFPLGFWGLMLGTCMLKVLLDWRRHLRLWDQSLRPLAQGREVESSGLLAWRPKLTGRSGPNMVRLTHVRGASDRALVEVEGPEGFSILKLRQQILMSKAGEIEIGDESFDGRFIIEGPVREVSARLDGGMRRQLLSAASKCKSLKIDDGKLRAEVDEDDLPRLLPILLDIGRRLGEPVDVESQIARNAREDEIAGVRLFNLLLLARERPGDPDTLEVLRDACKDESPEVRLRAAVELGEEGRETLWKLAQGSTYDATSAQAVSQLARALPLESLRDLLSRALRKDLVLTARACLEALGQRRAEAVDVLAQVVAEEKSEVAAAAALALGTTGAASAEPALLQALQKDDDALREAAAAALGRVGTVAAVQPLTEAAERSWIDLSLRRAARESIAQIQSRLEGASPGQLSLAGADGGQLSLAHDGGRLSLAADDAGQLALAPHETGPPADRIAPPALGDRSA